MNALAFVVFLGLAGSIYAQFDNYYCRYVQAIDCSRKQKEELCGSNGVTYRSRCELSQAYCRDNKIHKLRDGPCVKPTTMSPGTSGPTNTMNSTPPPTTALPVNGSEIAFDIFCLDLFHHDCSTEPDNKVCANDQMTYRNLCEYEKKKCLHRYLHIDHMGECM